MVNGDLGKREKGFPSSFKTLEQYLEKKDLYD